MGVRRAGVLVSCVALVMAGGCGGDDDGASDQGTTTTTTIESTTTTQADAGLKLVGLGDSIPAGLGCVSPCRSYVPLAAAALGDQLGQPVNALNLAEPDQTTGQLVGKVRTDKELASQLAGADIVLLQIGNNDWQGPCTASNHEECLENGRVKVQTALEDLLPLIREKVGDEPVAIRVLTYPDASIGDPNILATWGASESTTADFAAWYAPALAALDDTICQVAEANDASCVDLLTAFNGPGHDSDATELLGEDHFHPSAQGHERIAEALAAAGYAPVD